MSLVAWSGYLKRIVHNGKEQQQKMRELPIGKRLFLEMDWMVHPRIVIAPMQ